MTLQAKDLMVDDLVYIKDHPIKSQPQKVKPEHFVRSLVEFEPIPITPQILEKNGFVKLIADSKYVTYTTPNNKIFCTYVKETKQWLLTIGAAGSVKKKFVEVSCIDFVHELQHALKLCGIEKEIEL